MHCWWDGNLVQTLWKVVWRLFKRLKIKLPYDPAIPLQDIYANLIKTLIQKAYMHTCVYCSIVYNCQAIVNNRCPSIDKWIKKCGTYIQWNIITKPP